MENSMDGFPWVRDYFIATVRVHEAATPAFSTKYGKKWTLGRSRLISWPSSFLACPVPSVWSQIWKRKHQDAVLSFLAIDSIYFLNSKLNGKVLRIDLKQCLLWGQVSNFNLVEVGYYPILSLAVIACKVVHCLLLYIIYCILVLYIRYTNVQSYGLWGHGMA